MQTASSVCGPGGCFAPRGCGTHALIQETVTFHDLAFVVIDEQTPLRCRAAATLREKGYNPHLLVMTAPPIRVLWS